MLMGFSDPTADPARTFQRSVPVASTVALSDPPRLRGPAVGSRGERSQCSVSLQSGLSTGPKAVADSHCEATQQINLIIIFAYLQRLNINNNSIMSMNIQN